MGRSRGVSFGGVSVSEVTYPRVRVKSGPRAARMGSDKRKGAVAENKLGRGWGEKKG